RDDLGAGLLAQPARPAEVVDVAVGDDDRVDVFHVEAGGLEAADHRLVRLRAGHAGVDDGPALLVLEGVAVDAAEARHPDRELEPEDAGRRLLDLAGRRLGLFTHRTGGGGHRSTSLT